MPEPEFEVRPSIMVGDTADVSFHRGITVLRNSKANPRVTMEFSSTRSGVFCGIKEVMALLDKVLPKRDPEKRIMVSALEEGANVACGEIALSITAPYSDFGLYETAISGTLAHSTGWATASMECVTAASGIPVISIGARHVHPNVAGVMDYAAMVGGCVSCSTILGARLYGTTPTGTISPGVALIMAEHIEKRDDGQIQEKLLPAEVRAMHAFDRHMPQEVPRVSPVNVVKDGIEESLTLAKSMKQRLRGVVIDLSSSLNGSGPNIVKELRARLDLAGFSHVEVFLQGGLTVDRIKEFVAQGAPVNAFEVGGYISGAPPCEFIADIYDIEGTPVAKRGRIPGVVPNPRLVEVISYQD